MTNIDATLFYAIKKSGPFQNFISHWTSGPLDKFLPFKIWTSPNFRSLIFCAPTINLLKTLTSEYWATPVFKWSKAAQLWNGPEFQWYLKAGLICIF